MKPEDFKSITLKKLEKPDEKKIFEETRRCLLTNYRSNNQTHAGYIIAIIIGSLAFLSRYDIFLNLQIEPASSIAGLFYFGAISVLTFVSIYMVKRMLYWNTFSSSITHITSEQAIDYFIKYRMESEKKEIRDDEPYSSIIETGCFQHLINLRKKPNEKWITYFAVMKDKYALGLSFLAAVHIFLLLVIIEFCIL